MTAQLLEQVQPPVRIRRVRPRRKASRIEARLAIKELNFQPRVVRDRKQPARLMIGDGLDGRVFRVGRAVLAHPHLDVQIPQGNQRRAEVAQQLLELPKFSRVLSSQQ